MQRRMMPLYLKLASVSSRQCAFSDSDQPSAILQHIENTTRHLTCNKTLISLVSRACTYLRLPSLQAAAPAVGPGPEPHNAGPIPSTSTNSHYLPSPTTRTHLLMDRRTFSSSSFTSLSHL